MQPAKRLIKQQGQPNSGLEGDCPWKPHTIQPNSLKPEKPGCQNSQKMCMTNNALLKRSLVFDLDKVKNLVPCSSPRCSLPQPQRFTHAKQLA